METTVGKITEEICKISRLELSLEHWLQAWKESKTDLQKIGLLHRGLQYLYPDSDSADRICFYLEVARAAYVLHALQNNQQWIKKLPGEEEVVNDNLLWINIEKTERSGPSKWDPALIERYLSDIFG